MMFNFVKKWKAKRAGMPFKYDRFWPPFYISFGGDTPKDAQVHLDIYKAKVGDIIPVFKDGEIDHFYKLHNISRSPGSDHIVSPLQFDITYSHSQN